MRKIPEEYENPIDNILIHVSDYLSPVFYKLGFTPNMITTLSNISCATGIYYLIKNKYELCSFFVFLAYFFDCMDGHFARKYKMTSKFGDYYDHFSDYLKYVAIIYTLYKTNTSKFFVLFPIFIISLLLMSVYLGCQENYHDGDHSDLLNFTKELCYVEDNDDELLLNRMKYTKYFGCGTAQLIIVLAILYYKN